MDVQESPTTVWQRARTTARTRTNMLAELQNILTVHIYLLLACFCKLSLLSIFGSGSTVRVLVLYAASLHSRL